MKLTEAKIPMCPVETCGGELVGSTGNYTCEECGILYTGVVLRWGLRVSNELEAAKQPKTVQLRDVQVLIWGQDVVEVWCSAEDSIERRQELKLGQQDVRVLSLSVQGGEKVHECWECTSEDCFGCDKVARLAEFKLGNYAEALIQNFPCWLCGGDAYLEGYRGPHTVHCSHGAFECPNKHKSVSVNEWIMSCFESAAAKQASAIWVSHDGDEPLTAVPDVGQHASDLGGGCCWKKLQLNTQE